MGESDTSPNWGAVAGAGTALVTGVAALSLTGALGRVQRNEGAWFAVALGLVVVAAATWVIVESAGLTGGWRDGLRVASVVCGAAGVVLGFVFAVATANDAERPALSVRLDEKTLGLTGDAIASDLASHDRLVVLVDGLLSRPGGYTLAERLYQSYTGPNADGNASNKLDVQLPPGRFDAVQVKAFTGAEASACDRKAPMPLETPTGSLTVESHDNNPDPGCVILELPKRSHRPQLTALWQGSGAAANSLMVRVAAADLGVGGRDDQLVAVQVVGITPHRDRMLRLFRSFIEPSEPGAIASRFRVPVVPGVRTVCAEARYVRPGHAMPRPMCPLGRSAPPPVAATQLRVP